MKNYVSEGRTVNFTAASAMASGQVTNLGDLIVVAVDAAAAGAPAVGVTEGVFTLPKLAANSINTGEKVYLAAGTITDNSGAAGAVYAGKAFSDAGNGATFVDVKINA